MSEKVQRLDRKQLVCELGRDLEYLIFAPVQFGAVLQRGWLEQVRASGYAVRPFG